MNTTRADLIAAGIIRPARGEVLTKTRATDAPVLKLDGAARARAREHMNQRDMSRPPDGAELWLALNRPPLFGARPR